jgi:hypothetical protein
MGRQDEFYYCGGDLGAGVAENYRKRVYMDGTLFWAGFSDRILIKAGVDRETVARIKEDGVELTRQEMAIPVLYESLPTSRRNLINRCVHRRDAERPTKTPYCYDRDVPFTGDKRQKHPTIGGWMAPPLAHTKKKAK